MLDTGILNQQKLTRKPTFCRSWGGISNCLCSITLSVNHNGLKRWLDRNKKRENARRKRVIIKDTDIYSYAQYPLQLTR